MHRTDRDEPHGRHLHADEHLAAVLLRGAALAEPHALGDLGAERIAAEIALRDQALLPIGESR